MAISVAIVEDNKDLRVGTTYVLKASPALEVVGSHESAEELLDSFEETKPDVVLMDIESARPRGPARSRG